MRKLTLTRTSYIQALRRVAVTINAVTDDAFETWFKTAGIVRASETIAKELFLKSCTRHSSSDCGDIHDFLSAINEMGSVEFEPE